MAGALGKLLGNLGGGVETLPAPPGAPTQAPAGRTTFTIPLASKGDPSAIKVADEDGLISIAVRDAPLRHVLSMIADARNLNVVFASSTDVPVTATLDRLPIDRALDSLLSASGYMWTRNGDVIFVTSLAEAGALAPTVQGRRVAVLELDFASAVDIDQTVKGLLSPVGKSWFVESNSADNRRTNETVVVEDIEPYISRIEQYVAQADQPPRQVMIEVHMLQVDLARDQRAGVDLEAFARVSGARLGIGTFGMAQGVVTGPTQQVAIPAAPGVLVGSIGTDLSSIVEALIETTDAKTLASPRILAVNGQQSRIQIGNKLGYSTTRTTQAGSDQQDIQFLDVGVVLAVTPRITHDHRVLMRVAPKVSDGVVVDNIPDETTTEMETDVLLASGQGMIIGGLIQERDSTSVSRVPLLGSIPYAGFFFQKRRVEKSRSEIIVALTPHVLPYNPALQARNDDENMRVRDPLVHGPLCRFPRPYEPQLTDVMRDHPPWVCQQDEPQCTAACHATPAAPVSHPSWLPRRLPPIEAESATCSEEIARRRTAAPLYR